jgi:uncharacterized protein
MMHYPPYKPPQFLQNGLAMTLYAAFLAGRNWETTVIDGEPPYQPKIFTGGQDVPIFGLYAIPENPRGTIVATYGITGDLEDQWLLRILGRKAYAQGYAVVLFDWRAHGKTLELSPTLTSDGLYEGEDFVRIAVQAALLGCPGKFWFAGFSLGGQLALWAAKTAVELVQTDSSLGLRDEDIGGVAVICPSLDSTRSLTYLTNHPVGKYIERGIALRLKKLASKIHNAHPGTIKPDALARANSIWGFDRELVIERLGFETVEAYYAASSPLHFLPHLTKPTLIIYAANDPFFDPTIIPELQAICTKNSAIDLFLTTGGGHVVYWNSKEGQKQAHDPDRWWAWNRVLQWIGEEEGRE